MTSRAFDHDFWRMECDDWRSLGLHWHCYYWRGDGKSFGNAPSRRDVASELPPLIVREWLRKPRRLLSAMAQTPEEAIIWLRREFERHLPEMGEQATYIPEEARWGMALYDLRIGNDISWAFWLGEASTSIVSLAIVAVADCPHHQRAL